MFISFYIFSKTATTAFPEIPDPDSTVAYIYIIPLLRWNVMVFSWTLKHHENSPTVSEKKTFPFRNIVFEQFSPIVHVRVAQNVYALLKYLPVCIACKCFTRRVSCSDRTRADRKTITCMCGTRRGPVNII